MNNVAVNVPVHVTWCSVASFFLHICPELELLV